MFNIEEFEKKIKKGLSKSLTKYFFTIYLFILGIIGLSILFCMFTQSYIGLNIFVQLFVSLIAICAVVIQIKLSKDMEFKNQIRWQTYIETKNSYQRLYEIRSNCDKNIFKMVGVLSNNIGIKYETLKIEKEKNQYILDSVDQAEQSITDFVNQLEKIQFLIKGPLDKNKYLKDNEEEITKLYNNTKKQANLVKSYVKSISIQFSKLRSDEIDHSKCFQSIKKSTKGIRTNYGDPDKEKDEEKDEEKFSGRFFKELQNIIGVIRSEEKF